MTFTYATSGKAAASSSNCNSLANCSLITSDKEQDIVFWGVAHGHCLKKKKAIQNNEIKVTSKPGNKVIFWELEELNKLKRNV